MTLPTSANLETVLAVFFGLLVIFDIVLVRYLKLGKKAWKRVDYIWLIFAAMGVASAVAQTRTDAASKLLPEYEGRARSAFYAYLRLMEQYASDGSDFCRAAVNKTYTRQSDEETPNEIANRKACEWFQSVAPVLGTATMDPPERLNWTHWYPHPAVADPELQMQFALVDRKRALFNKRMAQLEMVQRNASRTPNEQRMMYLAPLLLAFAVALRITKVTGELRLEP